MSNEVELVELDETLLYNFLLSLGGDLQLAYIYKGQSGDPAMDVAKAICAKFGQRQTEDVGELVEMIRLLLEYYKSKINSPRVIYFKGKDIVDYAEQAIAKFKERNNHEST